MTVHSRHLYGTVCPRLLYVFSSWLPALAQQHGCVAAAGDNTRHTLRIVKHTLTCMQVGVSLLHGANRGE